MSCIAFLLIPSLQSLLFPKTLEWCFNYYKVFGPIALQTRGVT